MRGFVLTSLFLFAVAANAEIDERPSGLKVEVVSKPDACEKEAANGQMLTMHYTGKLEDGTKIDPSLDRDVPFKFQIGVGQVRNFGS